MEIRGYEEILWRKISSAWKAPQSQINITQLPKQSSVIRIKDRIIIVFQQSKYCNMYLSDKLSVWDQSVFFFFSALLLDDTSKRCLIPHVSEFILLFDSPTRTGLLFMVLPSLGAISERVTSVVPTMAEDSWDHQRFMFSRTVMLLSDDINSNIRLKSDTESFWFSNNQGWTQPESRIHTVRYLKLSHYEESA